MNLDTSDNFSSSVPKCFAMLPTYPFSSNYLEITAIQTS